jgi:phage terminase large subunit-like protein
MTIRCYVQNDLTIFLVLLSAIESWQQKCQDSRKSHIWFDKARYVRINWEGICPNNHEIPYKKFAKNEAQAH